MDNIDYILVTLDGEEPIEFECKEDGSFLLASLEAVAGCNLRYKNETTGNFRFVKVVNGEFYRQRMAGDYDFTTLAEKLIRVL